MKYIKSFADFEASLVAAPTVTESEEVAVEAVEEQSPENPSPAKLVDFTEALMKASAAYQESGAPEEGRAAAIFQALRGEFASLKDVTDEVFIKAFGIDKGEFNPKVDVAVLGVHGAPELEAILAK